MQILPLVLEKTTFLLLYIHIQIQFSWIKLICFTVHFIRNQRYYNLKNKGGNTSLCKRPTLFFKKYNQSVHTGFDCGLTEQLSVVFLAFQDTYISHNFILVK